MSTTTRWSALWTPSSGRTTWPLLPDTSTPAWRVDPGGLQVELPGTFDGLNTSDQVLAVAQVVFTVTENSNTDQVTFIWAGQPANVPDATGRLLARPVTRQDYGRFAG